MLILLALFGLIVGSFLGSLTWRLPRDKKVDSSRSICPHCRHKIAWRHNIPVISYLVLGGKCSFCHKKISLRYPLIELATAAIFVAVGFRFATLTEVIFFLVISSIALAIFVIDFEQQIIPDELVFGGLAFVLLVYLVTDFTSLFGYLLAGFASATFLLLTNLVTRGRGMGLGDVKLALFMGTVLGARASFVWLFLSFIIGGIVGLFLIAFGKTSFGKKIAFGPFLVIGFFAAIGVGSVLESWIIPGV